MKPFPRPLIDYKLLNARQKENYNYQKVSAILADYGFHTQRLTDDWNGADFIAQHIDGETILKIQLKGRLSFATKYQGKNLWIAFRSNENWYLYPHDKLLKIALDETDMGKSEAWKSGGYTYPGLSSAMMKRLNRYRLNTAEPGAAANP